MKAGATAGSRRVWSILPQRATGNTEEVWGAVFRLEQMGVIIPIAGCDTIWANSGNRLREFEELRCRVEFTSLSRTCNIRG